MRWILGIIGVILLFTLPGCTAYDRFQQKMEEKEQTATAAKVTAPPPQEDPYKEVLAQLQEEYVRLQEYAERLEQRLAEVQTSQQKQQSEFKRLQHQWETNFELLERSVEESIKNNQRQIDDLQKNSSRRSASPSSLASHKISPPQPTTSRAKKKQAPPLVETYSLIPDKAQQRKTSQKSREKKEVPAPEEISASGDPMLPLPPPSENEILDETLPAPALMPTPVETTVKDRAKPFSDPDLEEPQEPLILQRKPGVKRLYNQGMSAVIQQSYSDAIQVFQSLTRQFPDDLDSDNAHFWIGHSYYKLKQYDQAESAFRTVLRQYEHRPTTQGYKTPDAIYMLGKISEARKEFDKAKYYYRQAIKRFPGSAAARNSEKELKVLQGHS